MPIFLLKFQKLPEVIELLQSQYTYITKSQFNKSSYM